MLTFLWIISVSTARKLKSGSVSAVTFPAASLLLKCVPLASAKLQMQGTRTTFISAVIVNCDRSDPSSTLWCDLYFLSSYVQKDVWKELWRCVVPCTQLATEGVHWRWTNPSYFSTNTKKWKKKIAQDSPSPDEVLHGELGPLTESSSCWESVSMGKEV